MKHGDIIQVKKAPIDPFGYSPFKIGDTYEVDEVSFDEEYVTTTKHPELYINKENIEVISCTNSKLGKR